MFVFIDDTPLRSCSFIAYKFFRKQPEQLFLAPRNRAALLKAGAELHPDGKSCFYQLS